MTTRNKTRTPPSDADGVAAAAAMLRAAGKPAPAPLFQRFSYAPPSVGTQPIKGMDAAVRSMEVALGVETILAMIEQDDVDSECADETGAPMPMLLPAHERAALIGLARNSLGMLAETMGEEIERLTRAAAVPQA